MCRISCAEHNLDALLVVDASDHAHAHLGNLLELTVLNADVAEDLDHALPNTDARVLHEQHIHAYYVNTVIEKQSRSNDRGE